MSTYDSHDQVTSWFWDIVQDSSQQLREAILQWSTGAFLTDFGCIVGRLIPEQQGCDAYL